MEGITVNCGRGQVCDEESKMCVKGGRKPKPDSKAKELKKDDKEEAASKKAAIEEESAASNEPAARMAPVEPSGEEESSKPDPTGKDNGKLEWAMKSFPLDDNEKRSGEDFGMDYDSDASVTEGTGGGLDDAEPSETPKRSEDDEMKPESDGNAKWTPDVETTTEPNDETKPESDDKGKDPPGTAEEEESTETAPDGRPDSNDEPPQDGDAESGPDDPKNRKKGDLSKEEVQNLLKLELNGEEEAKSPDGSKEEEKTKTAIKEAVAETSSKEVVEALKEKTEEEVGLKQDNDLSIDQKEKASELIWDLESDERSEEDKISEENGKLQKLREDLGKAKKEDNETVKDFQEEIEARQKQIHDLSEKRDEIMQNKEEREAVKDGKSESVISEEIGELREELEHLREELEHLREDLVEEKERGSEEDIIREIKSEIETKVKEIHSLSEERDRMKEEKKQETGENEDDGIIDQKKVNAAEKGEEEADVVLKGTDGIKSHDVVSSDSDDPLILVEVDDHDSKKPTVLVTRGSESSELISAKESSPELDEILEEAKQPDNAVIKKSKGSSVKIYPSWDEYIQEQFMQVTGHGDESHSAGKDHTASDHKLGGQPQTKSGASQIVAVTKPGEKLNVIEEEDGSQVWVKETPLSGNQVIDLDPQPVPGQAPPESMVVPPPSDPTPPVAVQPSPGQAKAVFTPDYTAVQHQSARRMPLRRPWWRRPGPMMADFDDYGMGGYDYGGFDDYEMAPPSRSRRRRRRWNRRRNMRGRRRNMRGRRMRGRRMSRRSSRRSMRQPRDDWERKFYSVLKDHFFDDDEIELEVQEKVMKKVGARKELKSILEKPKYDPRMDSALNLEDDLGIWAADPIMKEKIIPESLGPWAADEPVAVQEKITLADLGPWASDDTVAEEPKITPAVLGSWAADPDAKSAKLGTWANDVELMIDDDEEDVDVPACDKEKEEEYFFDVENERGHILKEPQKSEHFALDKEMEQVWKSWAELMTMKSLLQKKGKRDPRLNIKVNEEGEKFERLLRMHAVKYGNPHSVLVPAVN